MNVLGIETSCDETAVAWIESKEQTLAVKSSLVSSQIRLHERFGGVVPEIATREHLRNLPLLTRQLLENHSLNLSDLDAIAVTSGPGLPTALLVGVSFARALGLSLAKPVFGINHLEGHLFSPFLSSSSQSLEFPAVALLVSGGHTLLMEIKGWGIYRKWGGTVDDAAGEAFDKVARLIGLPYPGGPQIEKWSLQGNPNAIDFPQSFPERDNFNFSFSGLKTSVRYFLDKNPDYQKEDPLKRDLCASFQKAVVEVLARKTVRLLEKTRARHLILAGGVACNQTLRSSLETECLNRKIQFHRAESRYCTDNAAMIGLVAAEKLRRGISPDPVFDFHPNLKLEECISKT